VPGAHREFEADVCRAGSVLDGVVSENSIVVFSQQICRWKRQEAASVLARRSTRQWWLVGVSHPLRRSALSGGTGPLWSRMRAPIYSGVAGQPKSWPHVEPSSKQQSWARQIRAVGVRAGFRKAAAQGAHAAPQRAPSDARDHAAARGVAARSIWSAARDALDRAAAATAASSTAAPCPDLSTPCVTVVLSTPANHNYPAARFAEARVAASCMPPSNLCKIRTIEFLHITGIFKNTSS
jgi:hypothetical protein